MREMDDAELEPESLVAARAAYEVERDKDRPNPSAAFDYGMELLKSPQDSDKHMGIQLLQDVIDEGYKPRECLFAIAEAYLELGEYANSRQFVERLLKRDPSHQGALELHGRIRERVLQDGPSGLLIAAGLVVAAAIALRYWLRRSSK